MKMKIQIVAVFCACVVAAFSKEFNPAILNQFPGKSLPPVANTLMNTLPMKLAMVTIANDRTQEVCYGVLLSRRVVAFPRIFWPGHELMAVIQCHILPPDSAEYIVLETVVPSERRLTKGDSIIEMQLDNEVSTYCWPREEERLTTIASRPAELAPIFGITIPTEEYQVCVYNDREILVDKISQIGSFDDNFIQLRKAEDFPLRGGVQLGEPIFMGKRIAGLYIPSDSSPEPYKYTRIRAKSNN